MSFWVGSKYLVWLWSFLPKFLTLYVLALDCMLNKFKLFVDDVSALYNLLESSCNAITIFDY